MIRTDSEYRKAVQRMNDERALIEEQRAALLEEGLDENALERLLNPLLSFSLQLAEEIEHYEKLRRGEFPELMNLRGIGHMLVSLRISLGLSQRELAKRLDVDESQISRDEKNEYFNISTERAMKVLDAMQVKLVSRIEEFPESRSHPESIPA